MKLPLGPHDTSANTSGTGDNALLFQSTQSLHCESAIVPVSVHNDSANGNILLLTNKVYVINKKKNIVISTHLSFAIIFRLDMPVNSPC